ncbi:MAG: two-component regulator propeller domain-containing protein, partial [Pseudomonadota bacterium]
MRFDRIGVSDGLSQSSVMAIAQDDAGFMWFGTQNGLDRYDGFSIRHYRRDRGNPNALASNFVRDLDLAADGTLWVATDGGGVSRWLPDTDTFVTYRHNPGDDRSLASDRVRVVLADNQGSIWVGTRDAGLDRLDVQTGTATHFRHVSADIDSVSSNDIRALALRGTTLWIATDAGLNKLDTNSNRITRYDASLASEPALAEDRVRTLFVDHEGLVWIGTFGAGLFSFDPQTERFAAYANSASGLSGDRVEAIIEDDRQRIWIGTDRGLSLIDRAHDHVDSFVNDPTDPGSLGDDSIFSM